MISKVLAFSSFVLLNWNAPNFVLAQAQQDQNPSGPYGPYSQYDHRVPGRFPIGPMRLQPQPQQQFNPLLQDPAFPSNSVLLQCTAPMQQEIRICARSLQDLGFMKDPISSFSSGATASASRITTVLPWLELRKKTKTQFQQVCMAFDYWDRCVSPYKATCLFLEPIKSQFMVSHELLSYVCRLPALEEIMAGWDCVQTASSKSDTIMCDQVLTTDSSRYGKTYGLTEAATCKALQSYSLCIRKPIYESCGSGLLSHVALSIQRPIQIYQPDCITGSAAKFLSGSLSILLTVAFSMFVLMHANYG